MPKIDLESISNNTKGITDFWHIDASGKSSPEVFQKHFGLLAIRQSRKLQLRCTSSTSSSAALVIRLRPTRTRGRKQDIASNSY